MRYFYFFLIYIIIIPVNVKGQDLNGDEIKVTISKDKTIINGISFYLHHVKKGENLYRISLAYGVKQAEIIYYNHDIESGTIKKGQILKIPVSSNDITSLNDKYVQKSFEYKVKRHDTEYSISKNFSVSEEDMNLANPSVNLLELKTGQIILIPLDKKNEVIQQTVTKVKDTPLVVINKKPDVIYNDFVNYDNTLFISMLIPFSLDENQPHTSIDSLLDSPDEKKADEANDKNKRALNFIEFYQGALIAIDSLRKTGIKIKLYTYDAGRDTFVIRKILNKPEMKHMDLIIGPFYADAVEQVGKFAFTNKIKMISPVWNDCSLLKSNPYLFEVIPDKNEYVENMLKYISNIPNKNIILVNSNNINDKEIFTVFKEKLDHQFEGKYKEYQCNDKILPINPLLANPGNNIIILPTEDEGIASNVLRMLYLIANKDSIKVFGLPVVLKWKNVEMEYFHNLEFHFYSSFYMDYENNKELIRFLTKYEKQNFSQPYYHNRENYPYLLYKEGYNFGYLGYDITFYFLSALYKYGPSFENYLNKQNVQLLHSNLNFERVTPEGGFSNKGVNILKFTRDYHLIRVN